MIRQFVLIFLLMGFGYAEAHDHYDKSLLALDKIRTSNPSYFQQQLNLLNKEEYRLKDKFYLDYLMGYSAALRGELDKAVNYYQSAINNKNDKSLELKATVSLANLYAITANYTNSLSLLTNVLSMIEDEQNLSNKYNALLAGAVIYNEVGQFQLAHSLVSKAEALNLPTIEERQYCLKNAIQIQAKFKLNEGIKNFAEIEDNVDFCQRNEEIMYANIMRFYYTAELIKASKLDKAESILLMNMESVLKTNYASLITVFYSQLAEIYKLKNLLNKSKEFASQAIQVQALDASSEEWVLNSYKILYEINKSEGALEQSLFFLEKHSQAERAYTNKVTAKQLAYQLAQHQTAEKNRQIELLNKRNEVLKLEQDLIHQSAKNNKLMVLLLIFILASLAFWTYRVKRNQIKLKKQSETDLLTGAASRHHFYFLSRKTLEFASSSTQEVSFVLFDLDKFKSVNDNYGHLVGDWVLKKVIEVCRPCWRQNDIAGRLGGEEFALMLPTCDLDKAVEIAEKCRQAIESVDTSESGHKFNISASFGVTTSKVSGYSLQDLIGDADRVMYQAKAAGKNQVLKVASKS